MARVDSFREGVVSLTYDDGLDSQLDHAVPALNARGLRGTFYVTWENIEDRARDWRRVAEQGHEVANHTMTHPCDISHLSSTEYKTQIAPLRTMLDTWERLPARTFAYPCDVTDLGPGTPNRQLARFKRLLAREGIGWARTTEGPPNSRSWALRHPYRLQALAAGYDATTLKELVHYVRRAQRERKWAILVFHDVGASDSAIGPIPSHIHDALLDVITREGISCRRVCDVVADLDT